jgi:hypothetical protein
MQQVNATTQMALRVPHEHEIVDVRADGTLAWTRAATMTVEPRGEETAVRFVDAHARVMAHATAHFVAYGGARGGILVLPDVPRGAVAVLVDGLGGTTIHATRAIAK